MKNLFEGKIKEFEKILQSITIKYMSFYDIANIEKVYQQLCIRIDDSS